MHTRFRISTRNSGRLRTIIVYVYDTVEEMHTAAYRHHKRIGAAYEEIGQAVGLCQAVEVVHDYESGRVRRLPQAGVIRLTKGALTTGVISHEATHMAVAIYKHDVAKTIPDMEREEKLAYLVGDITSKIVKCVYAHNYLKEPEVSNA